MVAGRATAVRRLRRRMAHLRRASPTCPLEIDALRARGPHAAASRASSSAARRSFRLHGGGAGGRSARTSSYDAGATSAAQQDARAGPAARRRLDARLLLRAPRRRSTCSRRRAELRRLPRLPPLGVESAALDLALRQAGRSLAEALGREPRPVTFVVSLRLGEPPSIDPVDAPPRRATRTCASSSTRRPTGTTR